MADEPKTEREEGRQQADVDRAVDAGKEDGSNNDWKPNSSDTEAQKGGYERAWRDSYDENH